VTAPIVLLGTKGLEPLDFLDRGITMAFDNLEALAQLKDAKKFTVAEWINAIDKGKDCMDEFSDKLEAAMIKSSISAFLTEVIGPNAITPLLDFCQLPTKIGKLWNDRPEENITLRVLKRCTVKPLDIPEGWELVNDKHTRLIKHESIKRGSFI
jgi:hypothetical protein